MDHMIFDEFKEVLAEDLKESLYTRGYEDVEIGFNHTNKANVEYEAMTIKPADGQIGINFNIEGFYQEYEKGVDYSELRHAIADLAAKSLDNAPEVNTNVLTDYEQMKDKLSLEVISKKGNEAFLENIPHKDLEDMAVYYRFVLDVHTNGEMQSITVTNNMLENYGITADKLHEDAIANAPNYRPAVIKTMTDTLREMMGVDMFDMFAEGLKRDGKDVIFVASTEDKVNGAGILAYPEFLKDAAEKLDGDFFVLPSSRHEVILIADDGMADYRNLQDMVEQVNASEVRPEDKLTDNVYHYDSKDNVFELASHYEERLEAKEAAEKAGEDIGDKPSILKDLEDKVKNASIINEKGEKLKDPKSKSKGGEAL
nr:DUF5688 family protein [uncultured Butyrivibrio sp.]